MRQHLPHELSVPGSLLLAGEYAVLVEGGLGLACAVEPRLRCLWHPARRLSVTAHYGEDVRAWDPERGPRNAVLDAVWDTLGPQIGTPADIPYALELDSRALFRGLGRKAGLGSSAAATVAFVTALLFLHAKRTPTPARVFALALRAHRRSQGGRGSGYDVACSTFGGLGCFRGGTLPRFETLAYDLPLALTLQPAPQPVATGPAIARWRAWTRDHGPAWSRYLACSQRTVRGLITCREAATFVRHMARAACLGRGLGRRLGVWEEANEPSLPGTCPRPAFLKALGAGNELYLRPADPADCTPLATTPRGILWN